MRIDAHIHFQPPEAVARILADAEAEPYWAMLLAPRGAHPPIAAEAERTLADMDRAAIDYAVIQGEYYQRHESCVAGNTRALALARRHPDRFLVFAAVQPTARDALDEVRRCAAAGARGVGEINPYAQGFMLDAPPFLRLAELCIELDLPLLLHTNEPVGRYYPGKTPTPLAAYYELALRYPELKLILAHWGGGLLFYELIPSARQALRNVWYDTAAAPLLYPTDAIFSAALQCIDHRKILFGSDHPLPLYPRRSRQPGIAAFVEEITNLNLLPNIRDAILGENAARLFGLAPQDVPLTDPLPARTARALPWIDADIAPETSVVAIAATWPATRAVFDQYGIDWQTPGVFWEPLRQAAAARGIGPLRLARLVSELNAAAQTSTGPDNEAP